MRYTLAEPFGVGNDYSYLSARSAASSAPSSSAAPAR